MARIDERAAKEEREKAEAFAVEAKQLRQVADHLDEEARQHLNEADALVGSSGRADDLRTNGTARSANGK